MKSHIQAILFSLFLGLLWTGVVHAHIDQSHDGQTSTRTDERYEFRFNKIKAKKIALQEELKDSGWDYDNLLYSLIEGRNCNGAPARYVIVLANGKNKPDFPISVIYDVTDSKRWSLFTKSAGDSLHELIYILKSPTFEEDIYCRH